MVLPDALSLFSLKDRVVIVTGGVGILGEVYCRGLAQAGASVVVADLDAGKANALADAIAAETGTAAMGIDVDVSDEQSVARMVDTVMARHGRIDGLVNNAVSKGSDLAALFAPVEDYSIDTWRNLMRVNLDGMFLVAKAVGAHMLEARRGAIVNVCSIYGLVGADKRIYEGSEYHGRQINTPPVYAAAKAGVLGLTRHLATHWADRGVRVNCLTPGGVESGQNDKFRAAYAARVPLGRMAHRHEMLGGMLYLMSDASSYVTGHNLVIDGGWTAW